MAAIVKMVVIYKSISDHQLIKENTGGLINFIYDKYFLDTAICITQATYKKCKRAAVFKMAATTGKKLAISIKLHRLARSG